jgi:hypothetical protein
MLSDFMQGLNSTRKHYKKKNIFLCLILFSPIYLLQEQKLNCRNYSEQVTIMIIFAQANEHDVHMHAEIQYLILHRFCI